MNFEQLLSSLASWAVNVGLKIVIALVILVVSFRVVTIVTRKIEKKLINGKPHLDKTLVSTLFYVLRIVVKSLIVVCLIGYLGIDTSGLTALFVSFGACVGLAVNGALSNLAGGVLIIVTRPFKIDDYIEAQGMSGTVEDIHITTTKLRTPDNKVVYIPNGPLSSGTIINYSEKELRRVDFNFSISYQNDFEKAKALVMDILNAHELVLKDPEPFVRVSSHADSSITVTARAWVKNADYWDVYFELTQNITEALGEAGINAPGVRVIADK